MNRYAIWRIDAADPVDGAIADPGRLLSSYQSMASTSGDF
jgi:hypothetical protein